jgi:hypothetical protein
MINRFFNIKECYFFLKLGFIAAINLIDLQPAILAAPIHFDRLYNPSLNQSYNLMRIKGCYHGKNHKKNESNRESLPGYRTELNYRCSGTYYQPPLTALIPQNLLAETLHTLPTFLWYVPYSSIKEADFTLVKDFKYANDAPNDFNVDLWDLDDFHSSGQVVYHARVPLTRVPGIIRFTLPPTRSLPTLEIGQRYFWQLKLIPEEYKNSPEPNFPLPVVTGWILRINPEPTLTSPLNEASPQERTTIYAKAGMWNDVLTNLAELSCSNKNSPHLEEDWQSALKALKLENLTGKPLVNCSSIEK